MGQPMSCASHQVIAFAPRERGIRLFELDVRFEVSYAESPQPAKYMLARLISKLAPILFAVFVQVSNRDDRRQGIVTMW